MPTATGPSLPAPWPRPTRAGAGQDTHARVDGNGPRPLSATTRRSRVVPLTRRVADGHVGRDGSHDGADVPRQTRIPRRAFLTMARALAIAVVIGLAVMLKLYSGSGRLLIATQSWE